MTETINDEARALRLNAWIRGLAEAAAQRDGDLELTPIRTGRSSRTGDLLLREALSAGILQLRERAEGEVEATNRGSNAVLILEGQLLPVVDRNPAAASSILVPALAVVVVSTVPADGCRSRVRVERTTGAGPAAAAGLAENFRRVRGQVGIVARSRGRLLGLELVCYPDAWAAIAPSAALDWAAAAAATHGSGVLAAPATTAKPGTWIDALASAQVTTRPARGLGREMTLRGSGVEGVALWHDGRPLHLVAHFV